MKKKRTQRVRISAPQLVTADDLKVLDVLGALGDEVLFNLFSTKYIVPPTTLSRKQYYSRLSLLKNLGLVTKARSPTRIRVGKNEFTQFIYVKTALGNVVFQIITLLERVLTQSWRWKGLDAFNEIQNMTQDERENIRNNLMDSPQIQEIIRVLDHTSRLLHEEQKQGKGGETEK